MVPSAPRLAGVSLAAMVVAVLVDSSWAASPLSCRGHCRSSTKLTAGDSQQACYCDLECLDNNDCCGDLRLQCPGVVLEHSRLNQPPGCKDVSSKCGMWSKGGFCLGAYADYMASE